MIRFVCSHCKHNLYFVIGLCAGISLSLIIAPVFENHCLFNESTNDYSNDHLPGSRSLSSEIQDTDEYEPRINLAGKPQKAQKTPQMLVRPRYYSTELGIREKLFVAVLTSQAAVTTRGVALNKTVAHIVDKVMYFIETTGSQKLNVSMPGVVGFTDTRTILKPFHMLKYITDNHLEDYDFYFIIKDTTYIKARELYDLVQHISVSENVHAGTGKGEEHSLYCSLDAGLLLSSSVLRSVVPNLDWCVKHSFSESDDDNFGRCVLHASKLPCQDSVQGQKLASFVLSGTFDLEKDFQKLSQQPQFESALTIYPLPNPETAYKLHLHFSKVALLHTQHEVAALRHSILNMSVLAPGGREAITWPVGAQGGNIAATRFDILRWDYFTDSVIYLQSDFSNVQQLSRSDKEDIQYVLNATIKRMELQYDRQLQFRRLVNGYRRFDPSRGMDYRLDLAFRDTSTAKEVHKRVEVSKPLGRVEVVPMPYVTENARVNLVLPIKASEREVARAFMQQYAATCMEKRDKTFLMLVFLYDPLLPGKGTHDDIFLELKQLAVSLSERYKRDGGKVAWVSIKLPDSEIAELGLAVTDLVVRKFTPESLILTCTPHMEVRQDYLNRVRMNTILQWQVFSPIPYAQFHPDIAYVAGAPRIQDGDINKNIGHYDTFATEYLAFYARDYSAVRRLLEPYIPMVRSDRDVVLLSKQETPTPYEMFLRYGDVHVLRAVEPGLRLRYAERDCGAHPSETCKEARTLGLGTRSQLARLVLDYQEMDSH